jgi:hypothetical protein
MFTSIPYYQNYPPAYYFLYYLPTQCISLLNPTININQSFYQNSQITSVVDKSEQIYSDTKGLPEQKKELYKNDSDTNDLAKMIFSIESNEKNSRRKLQSDGIRKKIMSNFLNRSTRKILNGLLATENTESKLVLNKLRHEIINKVNTEFIKSLISKTIREIFEIDNNERNLKIINEDAKDNSLFQNMLDINFEDAFNHYIKSEEYKYDMRRIQVKESKDYFIAYKKNVEDFIDYYKNRKPNRIRKKLNKIID